MEALGAKGLLSGPKSEVNFSLFGTKSGPGLVR